MENIQINKMWNCYKCGLDQKAMPFTAEGFISELVICKDCDTAFRVETTIGVTEKEFIKWQDTEYLEKTIEEYLLFHDYVTTNDIREAITDNINEALTVVKEDFVTRNDVIDILSQEEFVKDYELNSKITRIMEEFDIEEIVSGYIDDNNLVNHDDLLTLEDIQEEIANPETKRIITEIVVDTLKSIDTINEHFDEVIKPFITKTCSDMLNELIYNKNLTSMDDVKSILNRVDPFKTY